ncbi:MAG: enolase C-terminal domain-like protein [Microthrixaceae bacterium]
MSTPRRLRLVRVRVPMVHEHRSAHGAERERDVVLVEWTRDDGVAGWGECPTLSVDGYATETTERAWSALTSELGPAVLDGRMSLVAGVVAATAALADARLDGDLRARSTSLVDHLGATRPTLARTVVLAAVGDEPDALVTRARAAIDGGAELIKVKIVPGHDEVPLAHLRRSLPDAALAADANGSYAHPDQLAAVDRLGLRYLEQPFPATSTWDELARWHGALTTPSALDESLVSLDALRSALLAGAAEVVSVKPARLGGVEAAARAVQMAADAGSDVFVGGMLELGIGRAGAAAVAALPGITLPTDLGPSSSYVESDVCEPIVCDDAGRLVVPVGVGNGRTPDEARLEQVRVDEVVLGR